MASDCIFFRINGGLKVVYPLVEKPVPKVLQDIAANDFLSLSGYKIQYDVCSV